ncbi:OST-HTH/LOTUS domain-containing protein [Entomomonas sp. E2T0]|uniref:OST-HTH/LOTUS domain-containing protein n=1 Tax=Entomomonas sp. E2T0 TaxID=2930213 RepID=UPI002228209C|nr:OST-HTH/LOTUS domain-containing protein [Entomomonas sp. E2T0]UYZ82798.1 OST-HTH/LOTUS domain-containing protein [Entomomonas sp. E2T0]
MEQHPLSSKEDYQLAASYLDDCSQRFDRHIHPFHQLLESFSDTRDLASEFIKAPVIQDFFHGILPNGEGVRWERSTIVALLKDAEAKLSQDGWTSLQCAIEYIKQHGADHLPKRYGCSSWRHVLHESKQFEIRKKSTNDHQSRIWYCSHTK